VRCIDEANRVAHAVTLELQKLPVIVEYLEWLPPEARWKRLSELAVRQDGYITPSQARHVGYSDDVFLSLLPAGKIELGAADVYHLAHFPRAEREDLIVLWLQTDRRGIISHETALYLHDLCDILPSHLHVTVPPGWTPGDRNLAADVEIRHADVPEQDIRWLGPVPYTAPLRTVRDCIEVGVSPELIEQAIAEGIRRGLFTEADFPHLQRAESA
jgi:predicted transcriptional regulator of viral defense system